MIVARTHYVSQLWERRHNHLVKVITGIRRCGKSFLLFKLFRQRLLDDGVQQNHIIALALDDFNNRRYLNPENLYQYVTAQITDQRMYYVLLDEIQLVPQFEAVLNGFLHIDNVDVYVTGSNSRFLSSDIITEFRGRGDEVRIYPLSFSEFYSVYTGSIENAWEEYSVFGGMPGLLDMPTPERKMAHLLQLFQQTYMQDIINRYHLRGNEEINELMDVVASSVGSLTNPLNLTNTFNSTKHLHITRDTVVSYLDYMQDAFIIDKTLRYDIRGKHYIGTPMKYYFTDIGLRNARLHFRQLDKGSIMENVLYNELRMRGFMVDVGDIEINAKVDGKSIKKHFEIDFVCNQGSNRLYIQSAYNLHNDDKRQQEKESLLHIKDNFRKILIQHDSIVPYYDEDGCWNVGLLQFLTDPGLT